MAAPKRHVVFGLDFTGHLQFHYMCSFFITETSTCFWCRLYRVVAAPVFLRSFASDRRHMKRSDGSWVALPPHYDCLVAEGMYSFISRES